MKSKTDDAARRRFLVRIKVTLPAGGFGTRLNQMHGWLDENCGADGWAMTPAGLRGVINDATAIYFFDATSAAAFVARWCTSSKVEIADGAFQMGRNVPTQRIPMKHHKTL